MFVSARRFNRAIHDSVVQHVACSPIVDVSGIAERVRLEHVGDNIAREDIELLVMHQAQALGCAMIVGSAVEEL
jgi:hypothetical protein